MYSNKVYNLPIVKHFQSLGIVHLVMINFPVTVHIFAGDWQKKSILVRCDNAVIGQNSKATDLLSGWQYTPQPVAQLWPWVENPIWLHTEVLNYVLLDHPRVGYHPGIKYHPLAIL